MRQKLLSILALLLMAVTGAWAQESESFTTNQVIDTYTGTHFTITCTDVGDIDGINIGSNNTLTVTSKNGEIIKKVEYHLTYGSNYASNTSCSAGILKTNGNTWTVGSINSTTITIQCSATDWVQIDKVTVNGVDVTANSDGAATPSYWSTYYNATQSFTADENTTVYKAALNGTSSVTLTEVAGREIPAGQAVILKSTAASIKLTPATTTADLSDNVLKGGTTVTSGYDAYTLSRGSDGTGAVGFYLYNGASLDGSKAHLEIPSSSPARSFIGIGDGTTAIELPALAEDETAEWYSLDGQRLSGKPARKGIYVRNGQKYIIK